MSRHQGDGPCLSLCAHTRRRADSDHFSRTPSMPNCRPKNERSMPTSLMLSKLIHSGPPSSSTPLACPCMTKPSPFSLRSSNSPSNKRNSTTSASPIVVLERICPPPIHSAAATCGGSSRPSDSIKTADTKHSAAVSPSLCWMISRQHHRNLRSSHRSQWQRPTRNHDWQAATQASRVLS